MVPVDEPLAVHLGLPRGDGVLVQVVRPGSTAEAVGVQRLDVIVSLNGEPVRGEREHLVALFRRTAASTGTLTIEVIRQGERRTLTLER
jgi:S1-C subfamily serine protease